MSERRTVLVCGLILWVLTAWPAWIVDLPPLQDLPNHVASAWVQLHPDRFPELHSNGFFKTNSALFLFLHLVGKPLGLRVAAKLFVTLTLGVASFVYPFAASRFGSGKARTTSLVLWPFVHNWFVAMGMLDFSLGVALGLLTLVALDAHRKAPSLARGIGIALLGLLVWYTHAFALIVICVLTALEALREGEPFDLRAKLRAAWTLAPPLVPAAALTIFSVLAQVSTEVARSGETLYRGIPAILYGLWAEWLWSMTKWTLVTIVPCAVVAWYGLRRVFRVSPPFFSPLATIVLGVACLSAPHELSRWFFFGSRFFPFFWIALVLRMPSELPRWLARVLGACAVAYSVGLGIEYVWVASGWKRVIAAEPAVPERSHLLTLTFDVKGRRGDNTRPLTHVWAFATIDRDAMSPLFFAHSKSFPITYVEFPPRQLEQLTLEEFVGETWSRDAFCESRAPIIPRDCSAAYAAVWRDFWQLAATRFDHVMLTDPAPEVLANVPASFHTDFDRDGVLVMTTGPVP